MVTKGTGVRPEPRPPSNRRTLIIIINGPLLHGRVPLQ